MAKGRIRVRLKSYDARVIDSCCQQILDTAIRTGAKVVGPIDIISPTDKPIDSLTHLELPAGVNIEIKM